MLMRISCALDLVNLKKGRGKQKSMQYQWQSAIRRNSVSDSGSTKKEKPETYIKRNTFDMDIYLCGKQLRPKTSNKILKKFLLNLDRNHSCDAMWDIGHL